MKRNWPHSAVFKQPLGPTMASVLCRPAWLVCEGILFAALAGCGAGTDNSGGGGHAAGCVSSALVVCTKSGQVRGATDGNFRAFRGIPYAAPPVGNLRWRPPAAHESWTGVRDAVAPGNRCPLICRGDDGLLVAVRRDRRPERIRRAAMDTVRREQWGYSSA
jgi:hypothetical protein